MNESWAIDPKTRDFLQSNGSPIASTSLTIPAFYRIRIPRGAWMYAPDTKYGSDFSLMKKRFNGSDLGGVVSIAQKALQPLIDDGRANDVVITPHTGPTSRHSAQFTTEIYDAQGQVDEITLTPLAG